MNVLITGGLGNVGIEVVSLALKRGLNVFLLTSGSCRRSRKRLKLFEGQVTYIYGSLTDPEKMREATAGMDYIIHLAAILPPMSEDDKARTYAVNLDGTKNLIDGIIAGGSHAKMIFASSTTVMGPRHNMAPPALLTDCPNPIDHYTSSKVAAEKLLASSGIQYATLRLASVMMGIDGYNLRMVKLIFSFPLEGRNEIVTGEDTAAALLNSIDVFETDAQRINGQTFFIAGGKRNGCQVTNRQFFTGMLNAVGIGMLPDSRFTPGCDRYFMDWYDTSKSQKMLNYQNHTLDDCFAYIRNEFKHTWRLIRLVSPLVRFAMGLLSPYRWQARREKSAICQDSKIKLNN